MDYFTDLEVFAAIAAGAMHDTDHPGYTNKFLRDTNHPWVQNYKNHSMLEKRHLEMSLSILEDMSLDFTAHMSRGRRKRLLCLIEHMVLGTDMEFHLQLGKDLEELLARRDAGKRLRELGSDHDKITVLRAALHTADLSNPTKPFPLVKKWAHRIHQEFFWQGDEERKRGLPISPNMDR